MRVLDCSLCFTGSIELSVVLCGDPYICKLNQEWRGKASATDVLSFPAVDWDDLIPGTPLALGDIIISLDTAHRQAEEQGYAIISMLSQTFAGQNAAMPCLSTRSSLCHQRV